MDESFEIDEEISKRILPLGYVFASFLRKKKGCASVGGMSPQKQKVDEFFLVRKKSKVLHFTLNRSFSRLILCGAARSTPRYLSFHEERYERRV